MKRIQAAKPFTLKFDITKGMNIKPKLILTG